MKYFSMLIKPASSLCNLRCRYCFYCDVAEKPGDSFLWCDERRNDEDSDR